MNGLTITDALCDLRARSGSEGPDQDGRQSDDVGAGEYHWSFCKGNRQEANDLFIRSVMMPISALEPSSQTREHAIADFRGQTNRTGLLDFEMSLDMRASRLYTRTWV